MKRTILYLLATALFTATSFACGNFHLIKVSPDTQEKHGISAAFSREKTPGSSSTNTVRFFVSCPETGNNEQSFVRMNLELKNETGVYLKTEISTKKTESQIKGYFEISGEQIENSYVEIIYATSIDVFHTYIYTLDMNAYYEKYKMTNHCMATNSSIDDLDEYPKITVKTPGTIHVHNIHRLPQNYDEGTGCRTAPITK